MHAGLVEGGLRNIGRIDDAGVLVMSEKNEPMVNVVRKMMLAVHVEQHPGPDFILGVILVKPLDPERFDEEEIQADLGAVLLDPMNEKIIGIQLVGHD